MAISALNSVKIGLVAEVMLCSLLLFDVEDVELGVIGVIVL
jgi:hypothetical protein